MTWMVTNIELYYSRMKRGYLVEEVKATRPFAIGTKLGIMELLNQESPFASVLPHTLESVEWSHDVADVVLEEKPCTPEAAVDVEIRNLLEDILHGIGVFHWHVEGPVFTQGLWLVPEDSFEKMVNLLAKGSDNSGV